MFESTSINYSEAMNYINDFSSLSGKLESLPKASENAGLKVLEELGLASDFSSNFDRGISEIGSYISSVSSGCTSYLESVNNQDISLYKAFYPPDVAKALDEYLKNGKTDTDGKKSETKSSGGGGGGGGSGSESLSQDFFHTLEEVNEITGEEKAQIDNSDKQKQYLSSISMDELDVVIELLKKISNDNNIEIDKLLDEEYADYIKDTMLKEFNLSSDFKAMIDEGSSISLVNSLKSLIDGQLDTFKVDSVMASTLINAIDLYAEQHNTSLSNLLNNNGDSQVLTDAMTEFTKIESITSSVNDNDIQEKYQEIYNDENMSITDKIIKNYVDNLSDDCGTNSENLLSDNQYKNKIMDENNELNKVTKYVGLLSNCSNDQIRDSIRNISQNAKKSTDQVVHVGD